MFGKDRTIKDTVVVAEARNIVGIYAVYDRVAEECGPVFSARNDGVAMRAYRQMMHDNRATVGEYKLVRLASYDTISMLVSPEVVPVEVTLPPSADDLVVESKVGVESV